MEPEDDDNVVVGVDVGTVVVVVVVVDVVAVVASGVFVNVHTTCAPVLPEAAGKFKVKLAPEPLSSDVVPLTHEYVVV